MYNTSKKRKNNEEVKVFSSVFLIDCHNMNSSNEDLKNSSEKNIENYQDLELQSQKQNILLYKFLKMKLYKDAMSHFQQNKKIKHQQSKKWSLLFIWRFHSHVYSGSEK